MADDATVQDRVQELTWALVDEQIDADELQLLESLLLSADSARDTYVDCVQLHTDLFAHFADTAQSSASNRPSALPILGNLGEGLPPYQAQASQQ